MKPVLWLVACWFVVGLRGNAAEQVSFPRTVRANSRLQWDAPAGACELFIVHLYRDKKLVGCTVCTGPRLEMREIFREQEPGEYQIRIQSVSKAGVVSAPSLPLQLFWLGFSPLT